MAAEVLVMAESLAKSYRLRRRRGGSHDGTLTAVDGVSLTLAAGESIGLVGESGSGKSTLARMIAGLETPSDGWVEVCGHRRGAGRPRGVRRKAWGRELQLVFQDPYSSLDPRQRVLDVIEEVLRFHFGLQGDELRRRAIETLERVGIDERRADRYPRALSGGERQRVAIARAIAARPRMIILDEAVSALDVSIQAQILNLLADLREETGIAYLVLSHDLSVVRYITDRTLVMRAGSLVEQGATEKVLRDPQDDYTRLLLSCAPRPGWVPQRIPRASDPVD